jgi:hypothetical protein
MDSNQGDYLGVHSGVLWRAYSEVSRALVLIITGDADHGYYPDSEAVERLIDLLRGFQQMTPK